MAPQAIEARSASPDCASPLSTSKLDHLPAMPTNLQTNTANKKQKTQLKEDLSANCRSSTIGVNSKPDSCNNTASPLVNLPTEIRLRILKLLLWQASPIRKHRARSSHSNFHDEYEDDQDDPEADSDDDTTEDVNDDSTDGSDDDHEHDSHSTSDDGPDIILDDDDDDDDDDDSDAFYSGYGGRIVYYEDRNFHFHPAILLCCKQLRDEGQQYLNQNTVHVSVSGVCRQHAKIMLLGDNITKCATKNHPLRKFSKVHVEYYMWHFDRKHCQHHISAEESRAHRATLLELSKELQDMPHLDEITIKVRSGNREYCNGNSISEKFLEPLNVLRNMKKAHIIGVSDEYAKELESLMTGNTKSISSVKMMYQLEDYLRRVNRWYWWDLDIYQMLDDAWEAVEMYDWAGFKAIRGEIFELTFQSVCDAAQSRGDKTYDNFVQTGTNLVTNSKRRTRRT